jgi:hypothetical protein
VCCESRAGASRRGSLPPRPPAAWDSRCRPPGCHLCVCMHACSGETRSESTASASSNAHPPLASRHSPSAVLPGQTHLWRSHTHPYRNSRQITAESPTACTDHPNMNYVCVVGSAVQAVGGSALICLLFLYGCVCVRMPSFIELIPGRSGNLARWRRSR